MSFRKIYNQIGVFASICPSTGGHFIDASGNITTSQYSITGGITGYSSNSLYALQRVQDISYEFQESRIDIKNIGSWGTISRPSIVNPAVALKFSYCPFGLYNENILGFIFSSGTNVTPISGFLDRTFNFPIHRDCKNIFVATVQDGVDLNFIQPITQSLNGTTSSILKDNIYIYAFGDCYLDDYKFSAAVGNFPIVEANFSAYNIMYYSGGSGNNIPSVNPKDFTLRSGILYNIPPVYTGVQDTIILPGDITLTISETGNSNLYNLPIDFSDIHIQNFYITLNLNREPLQNIGYKIPMDRIPSPPIYANLNLSTIVGNNSTGSFIDFINKDTEYNIFINMNYSKQQPITGSAISFQFLSCKFNNIQISDSIPGQRTANLSLTSELNPNLTNKGFFISGQLGVGSNYPIY